MKYVYVINENGRWDYEECSHIAIYDTFEKALEEYKRLVETAKKDMAQWLEKNQIDEVNNINETEESASFEIYKNGYYDEFNDCINLNKMEVK